MKINKVDVLVTKIEVKENKDNQKYLMINLLDLGSGDNFDIISKEIELLSQLKPMTKAKVNLNLSSNKYGLKLDLLEVLEVLGGI
ncbi:hypothetical protein [Romboutsia ilealis]|uniref:hypothetical protein n=1 Tax=Romboutsia ilealis TaxID=1115758 RepID=UPI002674B1E1|nr:hypothetical protein [Romboutsia ilealis]